MGASKRVILDRIAYEPPVNGDHLIKVPRKVLFMSANDYYENGKLVCSGIVCDGCGNAIMTPYVWILVLANPWRVWGAICEDCKKRYHSNKPAYVMVNKQTHIPI